MARQRVERLRPKASVVLEPVVDPLQRSGGELEVVDTSLDTPYDEVGFFEDAQVATDGWQRHGVRLSQLPGARWSVPQPVDDRTAYSMRERRQHLIEPRARIPRLRGEQLSQWRVDNI